jgi:hypothetical protein
MPKKMFGCPLKLILGFYAICDMHLKLDILNPLNIDFEIFEWFGFSSSSSNEHVLS